MSESVSQSGFSSRFELHVKENVLFSFVELLKEKHQMADEYKHALMASVFYVAFSQVINFSDYQKSLEIIQQGRQYRLINRYNFFVATRYLKLLRTRLKNNSTLLKYIAGFLKILLPKEYVDPAKYLCRMPYKGPVMVEV
jgi:hypothetical protein